MSQINELFEYSSLWDLILLFSTRLRRSCLVEQSLVCFIDERIGSSFIIRQIPKRIVVMNDTVNEISYFCLPTHTYLKNSFL